MLLQSNTFIPQVYGKERDIKVFTDLLDILLSCCKYDIDNIGNVYNANLCPEQLLPLLAYTLNFEYNFSDTVSSNRSIIESFAYMERYKGSKIGMRMATALSLTSLDISQNNAELLTIKEIYLEALSHINITYDYENATITIDYPNVYTLVKYILDYVRPVGMWLNLRSIVGHNINSDVLIISSNIEADIHKYNPDIQTKVSKSFVNFSSTVDSNWLDSIENNTVFTIVRS